MAQKRMAPWGDAAKLPAAALTALLITGCACGFGEQCVGPCEEEEVPPPVVVAEPPPTPPPPPPPPAPPKPPAMRIVYFDFDDATVRAEDMALLSSHAAFLRDHDGYTVTVEGHCDERGAESYNNGLGMKRAQAVQDVLTGKGVAAARIEAVSFGESRPASAGRSEADWAKNRRAVIIYYE